MRTEAGQRSQRDRRWSRTSTRSPTRSSNFVLEAHRQTRFRDGHRRVRRQQVDHRARGVLGLLRSARDLHGAHVGHADGRVRRRRATQGIDGELVLRRGVKVWIEAALVHGPFHGDVHAGNLWVLDDGRSTYLDFGIMGELPPTTGSRCSGTCQYTVHDRRRLHPHRPRLEEGRRDPRATSAPTTRSAAQLKMVHGAAARPGHRRGQPGRAA